MSARAKVEIEVALTTAEALLDERRRAAVGRIVDRMVSPGAGDPLLALLQRTAAQAREAGFTDDEVEAELSAYNAERRD